VTSGGLLWRLNYIMWVVACSPFLRVIQRHCFGEWSSVCSIFVGMLTTEMFRILSELAVCEEFASLFVCVCLLLTISDALPMLQDVAFQGDHIWMDTHKFGDFCFLQDSRCRVTERLIFVLINLTLIVLLTYLLVWLATLFLFHFVWIYTGTISADTKLCCAFDLWAITVRMCDYCFVDYMYIVALHLCFNFHYRIN